MVHASSNRWRLPPQNQFTRHTTFARIVFGKHIERIERSIIECIDTQFDVGSIAVLLQEMEEKSRGRRPASLEQATDLQGRCETWMAVRQVLDQYVEVIVNGCELAKATVPFR